MGQISDDQIVKLRPSLSGEKLLLRQQALAAKEAEIAEEDIRVEDQPNMIDDESLQRPLSPKASEIASYPDYASESEEE